MNHLAQAVATMPLVSPPGVKLLLTGCIQSNPAVLVDSLPLNPRLIYFYQADVEAALRKVGGVRGERWVESHVREKVDSAFGLEKKLSGFEGLVPRLSERASRGRARRQDRGLWRLQDRP